MRTPIPPYEDQRRRLRVMEKVEATFAPIAVARRKVARATALTPAQLVAIRKGRPKDLYGSILARIDAAFVAWALALIGALHDDIRLAHAGAGDTDASVVEALEALVEEARRAGVAMPEGRADPAGRRDAGEPRGRG